MAELRFTWDSRKATRNRRKHGVDFAEAESRLISARRATRTEQRQYVERLRR